MFLKGWPISTAMELYIGILNQKILSSNMYLMIKLREFTNCAISAGQPTPVVTLGLLSVGLLSMFALKCSKEKSTMKRQTFGAWE